MCESYSENISKAHVCFSVPYDTPWGITVGAVCLLYTVHGRLKHIPPKRKIIITECSVTRVVARILFLPRQKGEPKVWGQSPQRAPGAEPLVRGSGGFAPWSWKLFSMDTQRKSKIYYNFLILRLIHYSTKCLKLHITMLWWSVICYGRSA